MRTQRLPPSLREAVHELVEKMSARSAILRYERSKPPEQQSADHALFEARLVSELRNLEELWTRVLNAWSTGSISVVYAVAILRLPPTSTS